MSIFFKNDINLRGLVFFKKMHNVFILYIFITDRFGLAFVVS